MWVIKQHDMVPVEESYVGENRSHIPIRFLVSV